MQTTTIWTGHDDQPLRAIPDKADTVVIGGGIAGATTALRLARAGVDTVLITAGRVGEGVTGRSNAKVTALHQLVYADLVARHGRDVATTYASANVEAVDWLRDLAGVEIWQDRDAVTVARSASEQRLLAAEREAAIAVGLPVGDGPSDDWPTPHQALRLPGQGQVDPVALMNRLGERMQAAGVTVVEGRRVTSVTPALRGHVVDVSGERVSAEHVVVTTGLPFLDRGGYFALCEPESSYIMALAHPGEGGDMLITADEPKVSVRWVDGQGPDDRVVLVGGQSHRTGAGAPTTARYDALESWARANLTGVGDVVARWSAMDFMSPDRLPFAGPLHRVGDGLLVITGLSKWGFSLGTACAGTIERIITGRAPTAFDDAVHPRRVPGLRGVGTVVGSNAAVARHMTEGWVSAMRGPVPEVVMDGQGEVGRKSLRPTAVCQVDGKRHERSAICPHLGGIVTWNDGDQTWDCPLHGSRFEADGDIRHGPANRPLGAR